MISQNAYSALKFLQACVTAPLRVWDLTNKDVYKTHFVCIQYEIMLLVEIEGNIENRKKPANPPSVHTSYSPAIKCQASLPTVKL